VTTNPKHYADDTPPAQTPAPPPEPVRGAGWWLPVTRGEFDDRMTALEQGQRRIERTLQSIDGHVVAVEEITTYIGEKVSEATDLLAEINSETNDVATKIDDLVAELANQSDASPEVLQGLRDVSARLQGLAADPDNPVPGPVGPGDPA
jgi:ABC-type transporter Mla subunit MlaD